MFAFFYSIAVYFAVSIVVCALVILMMVCEQIMRYCKAIVRRRPTKVVVRQSDDGQFDFAFNGRTGVALPLVDVVNLNVEYDAWFRTGWIPMRRFVPDQEVIVYLDPENPTVAITSRRPPWQLVKRLLAGLICLAIGINLLTWLI